MSSKILLLLLALSMSIELSEAIKMPFARYVSRSFRGIQRGVSKAARGVRTATRRVGRAANAFEARAKRRFVNQLHLRSLPGDGDVSQRKAARRLSSMVLRREKDNAYVVQDMRRAGVKEEDLMYGSHFVRDDNGALYRKWSKDSDAEKRISSHYKGVKAQQYEMEIAGRPLLFGKTASGDTWFQMERSPASGGPVDLAKHMFDYGVYRATGKNVGPLGLSPYRDSNPIELPAPAEGQQ